MNVKFYQVGGSVSTERIREELLKMFQANSEQAMLALVEDYPNLRRVVFERGLWFKPTIATK